MSETEPNAARRALVTGASRGIGAAVAKRLAADGFEVLVNYRSGRESAQAVVSEILAAGGRAQAWGFDVAHRAQTEQALLAVLEQGPVAVVVNNAGVIRDGLFHDMTGEAWDDVIATTLGGFFHVTRPLVPAMMELRFGRIINMSSISGVRGNKGQVNYSAAKAGLIGATMALSRELAKHKITVNAIAPGLIATEMIAAVPPQVVTQIPARRIGKTQEVAGLVSYLCSAEAGYLTGQVIGIDGGMS